MPDGISRAELRRRARSLGEHRARGKRGRREKRAEPVTVERFPELVSHDFVIAAPRRGAPRLSGAASEALLRSIAQALERREA